VSEWLAHTTESRLYQNQFRKIFQDFASEIPENISEVLNHIPLTKHLN